METVRLGKTGLMVSRIGIGGIPILRPPEDEAILVIKRALDLGVTFIDTSIAYGESEARIGKAIAGHRHEVVLATKSPRWDKATASKHIESSLKRLNTDYIDLWQFHNIATFEEYEQVIGAGGAMEAAQEALQAGRIRHIGFSSHSLDVALKIIPSGHFDTVQFPFNFINNEPANELVQLARKHNVGFIAMKPFAGGQLKDANLAIKYLLQFDSVVPIPGIQKIEDIEEIVDIVNGSRGLMSKEREQIETIRRELGTRFCQWCEYCMPCPEGVNIPWLMNIRTMGSYGGGFFTGVTMAVESANNCNKCGECENKCPFHLPIREMIDRNIEYFNSVV